MQLLILNMNNLSDATFDRDRPRSLASIIETQETQGSQGQPKVS
jgi:hypothetical protein